MSKALEFVIQPIDTPPGRCGQFSEAKLYDARGFAVMPFATAYLRHSLTGPIVEFILVPDQCRLQGYATNLLEFCFQQWPELQLTDGVSEAGEALVAKFEQKGGAE